MSLSNAACSCCLSSCTSACMANRFSCCFGSRISPACAASFCSSCYRAKSNSQLHAKCSNNRADPSGTPTLVEDSIDDVRDPPGKDVDEQQVWPVANPAISSGRWSQSQRRVVIEVVRRCEEDRRQDEPGTPASVPETRRIVESRSTYALVPTALAEESMWWTRAYPRWPRYPLRRWTTGRWPRPMWWPVRRARIVRGTAARGAARTRILITARSILTVSRARTCAAILGATVLVLRHHDAATEHRSGGYEPQSSSHHDLLHPRRYIVPAFR